MERVAADVESSPERSRRESTRVNPPHLLSNATRFSYFCGSPNEKDTGSKTVDRGREAQIPVHGQRRETDIHSVEIIRDIKQHHKRDQSPRALDEDLILFAHPSLPLRSIAKASVLARLPIGNFKKGSPAVGIFGR